MFDFAPTIITYTLLPDAAIDASTESDVVDNCDI
jgi:hypothetical protein